MIYIIITSYKEPIATVRAVESVLNQKTKEKLSIIVVDPFQEVGDFLLSRIKDKRVRFFLDPGEGKSYALNILLEKIYTKKKNDIIIFTDGDVFISNNAVSEISQAFKNKKIGCVAGKPVPIDSRNTKYGFWAHVAFLGIDKARKKLSVDEKFFECSGYLFAIRNGVINQFPLKTSEDSIIPYLFWKKGYKILYADKAEAYIKNPDNWKDYIAQKIRNIKAHENLNKIAPDLPRTKSFFKEIKEGALFAIKQPRNTKELVWALELYIARLYIYIEAFNELRKRKGFSDGWRETEIKSTKPFD